jgi:hypothetical protein
MELLDPTHESSLQELVYAPRPLSLRGMRIGLIDNAKFNSDRLLQKIGDILKAEYGVAETRMWRKQSASVPADAATVGELRATCDLMVAGIGD